MNYGLIIAAGNQTRFKSQVPKALAKISQEKTLLDENITALETYCDRVYVVIQYEQYEYFKGYPVICINSGYGCGDAVLKALDALCPSKNDMCFIQWGDCLIEPRVYFQCAVSPFRDRVTIPCSVEKSPYVQLSRSDNLHHIHVSFSKYNEPTSEGYHDLSIFYGPAKLIRDKLAEFALAINTPLGYVHKHNNELQFLDVFNETDLQAELVEIPDYRDWSFNTVEELQELLNVF